MKRCKGCGYAQGYCICAPEDNGNDVSDVSGREDEWMGFAGIVAAHVGGYTVQQYGDIGEDNVTNWSAKDCEKQIEKYVKRFGSGARGFDEAQRDLLKIAHYACLTYNKRRVERANDDATLELGFKESK